MDEFDEMMQSLGIGAEEDEPAPSADDTGGLDLGEIDLDNLDLDNLDLDNLGLGDANDISAPAADVTDTPVIMGDTATAGDDADFDEFEALLSAGGVAPEAADAPAAVSADDDLDAKLAELMKQDEEAQDNFEHMDAAPKVSSRSVYDGGSVLDEDSTALIYSKEEAKAKSKKKKGKLFDGLTVRKILVAGFILFFIFVGAGAAAVVVAHAVAEERQIVAGMQHYTPLFLPQNVANNANFVPVHQRLSFAEQDITFTHFSLGYLATYVYFAEVIDPDDFYILLFDQQRRLYVRQSFDLQYDPAMGTILRFDPLLPGVRFLTLHVQNRHTREYGAFSFRLLGNVTFGAPLFINQPIPLTAGADPSSGIRISHIEICNTQTTVYYSFTGVFDGVGLRKRGESNGTFVHLRDNFGGATVLTDGQAIARFEGNDAWIGRATFGPLLSMHSQMDITFHDLYYVYEYPPVDIPLRHLSGRNQDYPHPMNIGPFILNLEAMAQQGHLLVLVMHGTDTRGNRLPTHVGASLHIDLGRGEYIYIPAQMVNVAPRGTDVVFNLMPYIEALQEVHIDRYTLILSTAEFGVPEVTVSLDMEQGIRQRSPRRVNAEESLHAAFMSRLSYISGEIGRSDIIGFAPELLDGAEIMQLFTPRHVNERPMYGATIVAGDLIDNYTFLAVVESEWAQTVGQYTQFFRTVHRVVAQSHEGIWSIVYDTLL